jgi:hypothetical protein
VNADSIALPIVGGGRSEVLALVSVVKVATIVKKSYELVIEEGL